MNIPVNGTFLAMDTSVWISLVLDLAIKSSLILLVLNIVLMVLKKFAASIKSIVWTCGFAVLLFLPLIELGSLVSPQAENPKPIADISKPIYLFFLKSDEALSGKPDIKLMSDGFSKSAPMMSVKEGSEAFKHEPTFNISIPHLSTLAIGIWFLGLILGAGRLLKGLMASRTITKMSYADNNKIIKRIMIHTKQKLNLNKNVEMRFSKSEPVPFIYGIKKLYLVLPETALDWSRDLQKSVILHELSHAKRNDLLRLILIKLACSIYWFNPLVWFTAKRARLTMENACDDTVIDSGAEPTKYAKHLFNFVISISQKRSQLFPIVQAMVQPSMMERRLVHILDTNSKGIALGKISLSFLSLFIVLAVLPITGMQLVKNEQPFAHNILHRDYQDGSNYLSASLQDIMQCFPEGDYDYIAHKNFATLQAAENYSTFINLFNPSDLVFDSELEKLPDYLKNRLESISVAKTNKIVIYDTVFTKFQNFDEIKNKVPVVAIKVTDPNIKLPQEFKHSDIFNPDGTVKEGIELGSVHIPEFMDENGNRKPETIGLKTYSYVGDHSSSFVSYGYKMMVLHYKVLDPVIKQAINVNQLVETEYKIGGKTVYQLKGEEGEHGRFLLAVETQDLLIADKLSLLKKMFDAWSGNDPGVTSNPDLNDLFSFESELGQIWVLEGFGDNGKKAALMHYRRMLESNNQNKVRIAEEIIKRIENQQENDPYYFDLRTYQVDSEIKMMSISVFNNEKSAEYAFSKPRGEWEFDNYNIDNYAIVKEAKALHDEMVKSLKIDKNKNYIRRSVTIDKNLIKLARIASKKIEEMKDDNVDKK